MSKLALNDVNIYYGDFHAVQNVNMQIPAQAVTAFIGPSGCGKSTVLRTINRMHEVIPGASVKGEILLDGTNIYGPKVDPVSVRNTIGMVFQKANPFPTMSIEDNVVAGLKLSGEKNKKKLKEVAEKSLRGANLWDELRTVWTSQAAASPVVSSSVCASPALSPWSQRYCSWTSLVPH